MKIKQLSTKRLSISLWQMDLRLPGILLLLISGFLLTYYSVQYQIDCKGRLAFIMENCTLKKSLPPFIQTNTPLGNLRQAYVVPYLSHDGLTGPFYSIMLESDAHKRSLMWLPSPHKKPKTHTSLRIEHFIKFSHADSFTIPNPHSVITYYFLVFFVFFAIFMIIRVNFISMLIDKNKNVIYLDWINPYRSVHKSIDISSLKTVDVQSRLTKRGKRRYRLAFFLKDREVIPFSKRYSYFFAPKRSVAVKLNHFLGIMNTVNKGKVVRTGSSRLLNLLLVLFLLAFIAVIFHTMP